MMAAGPPDANGSEGAGPPRQDRAKPPGGRLGQLVGSLGRNASYLVAGTGIAQVIALLVTPLLTRLFTPEDFGALAAYTSVAGFLIAIAAGRYELAVVLSSDRREAAALIKLCLCLITATTAACLIGVLVLLPWYRTTGLGEALGLWVLLLPVSVFVGAVVELLLNEATRAERFRRIGSIAVIRSAVSSGLQLLFGALKLLPGAAGLVLGTVLGLAAGSLRLGTDAVRLLRAERPTWREVAEAARRHSQFPRFNMPASVVRSGVVFGAPIIIGGLFGAAVLGIWSVAYRFLLLPGYLVSGAVARAYFKQSVTVLQAGGDTRALFDRTVGGLTVLALPIFLVVGIGGEWLFGTILGSEWSQAGTYARLMLPWIAVQFVSAAVSPTAQVHARNQLNLYSGLSQFASLALATALALVLGWSVEEFLLALSLLLGGTALVFLWLWRSVTVRGGRGSTPELVA